MRLTVSLAILALSLSAHAASSTEATWLRALADRVIADVTAGKPLTVEVHVPLCDNTILACGNAKLGDGNNPDTNLYWSTTPGFGAWFTRRGSGWKRVSRRDASRGDDTGDPDVLAIYTYRRTMATPTAWRRRGAPETMTIELTARAWRGTAIDRALAAYAADVSGGSQAHIVAWVGHNRLMDLDTYRWPAPGATTKGTIAIACHTAAYMEAVIPAPTRVPLLMTRDYLFANAAPLEAAVLAFARDGNYETIRRDAATAYAGVQKRTVKQVAGAFTNPADRRWHSR